MRLRPPEIVDWQTFWDPILKYRDPNVQLHHWGQFFATWHPMLLLFQRNGVGEDGRLRGGQNQAQQPTLPSQPDSSN